MRWFVLTSVMLLSFGYGTVPDPPKSTASPALVGAKTSSTQPAGFRPSPAEVIAKAGRRPSFGAASDGRVLLAWSAGYGPIENKSFWSAYRVMDGDRVVSERLLTRTPAVDYFVTVEPMPGGFLVMGYGKAPRFVSSSGGRSRLLMATNPTGLRSGDVPVGIFGWLYRPRTQTVHTAVRAPGGTLASHVDGSGAWWSLGEIEGGLQVLWSRNPGEPWLKHLAGPQVPYVVRCTCPWQPTVEGRGPVVVASMGPLNHVSLDYGATWHTYDLGDSEPFQTVYDNLREPITSALPDGRIVTGYMLFWVAEDASNTSFRSTTRRSLAMWRAGLSVAPVRRGDTVSLDGGQTWVPMDPEPAT
jgi:hypothetical protein